VTLKFESAHVIADILEAALPGELSPELSDTYRRGPRGGVHGVDHRPEAGPSPRRYGITQAIAWRSGSIHHGETLSYAPGGPGRYARYGHGYRLPAGPTTDAILAVWTARNVRTVEAGQLSVVVDRLVAKLAAQDPVDRKAVAALRRLAAEFRRWERAGVFSADDPSTKPSRLAALVSRSDLRWLRHSVFLALAGNPSTPVEALVELAARPSLSATVAEAVAHHPSTPTGTVIELVRRSTDDWTVALARDPSTPPEVLVGLADGTPERVRRAVAGNPSTPAEVLVAHSLDEDWLVRSDVAGNPSTPPEVLARLAGDVDGSVRESVAGNASAPPETLARLAGIEDHLGLVGANLASNVSTPPEVLAALAEGADRVLRRHLARNVSTPPEVLAALAVDGDFQASDFARHNPSTPIALTAA